MVLFKTDFQRGWFLGIIAGGLFMAVLLKVFESVFGK